MKILVVSQYFWPEHFIVNELCSSLSKKGHDITVLTGCPNYPSGSAFEGYKPWKIQSETYDGVRVHRVPLIPRGRDSKIQLALNYLSYMTAASCIGPFLCRERYDAIFVMQLSPATVGIPAIVLKWLKRVPIVFWIQDLWPESVSASGALKKGRITRALTTMMKFIYKNCDHILVQSEAFREAVHRLAPRSARIDYLPNWAPSVFDICPSPSRDESNFNVVFGGNLGHAQNVEIIVRAAELLKGLPSIRFTIVGDGSRAQWMREEVEKKHLKNMDFLGRQPIEKMPAYFANADCLLVTLRKEPIFDLTVPSKVQVYLASGKPIVAALEGEGARVIEESKAGLHGPCENAEILAENIKQIYNMTSDERLTIGENGRDYFESHFRHDIVVDKLESVLSDASSTVP